MNYDRSQMYKRKGLTGAQKEIRIGRQSRIEEKAGREFYLALVRLQAQGTCTFLMPQVLSFDDPSFWMVPLASQVFFGSHLQSSPITGGEQRSGI